MTAAAAFIAAVYLPSLRVWFLGDDLERIWRSVADDRGVADVPYPQIHWRPLENLSFRIDHWVNGLSPEGFHATNVMLHVVVSLAVGTAAVLLVRYLRSNDSGARWTTEEGTIALFATLAFGLLPSHGEAVVWIAGRGDLLMAAFALAALLAHVTAERATAGERRSRRGLRALSMLAFVGALSSKEPAVALVGIVAVLEVARTPSRPSRARMITVARRTAPFLCVAVAWFGIRRLVLGSFVGGFAGAVDGVTPGDLVRRGLSTLTRTLVPAAPRSVWIALILSASAAGLAVLALLVRAPGPTSSAIRRACRSPRLRASATFGVCAAVAVVPVAALGTSPLDPAGERLAYFPSVFAVLAVGELWALLRRHLRRTATVVAVAGAIGATALLLGEQRQWLRAGEMAQTAVTELGELPRDEAAVILSMVDTYRGIYVTRNAIPPALVLFHQWHDPSVVWQATGLRSAGADDEVRVRRVPNERTPTWVLSIDAEAVRRGAAWDFLFARPASTGASAVTVDLSGPSAVRVGVPGTGNSGDPTVWSFVEGELRPAR